MEDLSEASIGWERIDALVHRDQVVASATCPVREHAQHTEFWLALLGWTLDAFVAEAYPEFDESIDG